MADIFSSLCTKATVTVPAVCFDLMRSLRTVFGDTLAMRVEDVIKEIQRHYVPLAAKGKEELQELLHYLSVMGMVSQLTTSRYNTFCKTAICMIGQQNT